MIVLVPRSAGSGATLSPNSCSDTCLPARFSCFSCSARALDTPLPPNINIYPPVPPPLWSHILAFRITTFRSRLFVARTSIDVSLCPFASLLFVLPFFRPLEIPLSSIYLHEGLFSSLFITIKQDSSPYPYPYPTTLTNLFHHTPQPPAPLTLRYVTLLKHFLLLDEESSFYLLLLACLFHAVVCLGPRLLFNFSYLFF